MIENTLINKLNYIIEQGGEILLIPLIILCNDEKARVKKIITVELIKEKITDELIIEKFINELIEYIAELKNKIHPDINTQNLINFNKFIIEHNLKYTQNITYNGNSYKFTYDNNKIEYIDDKLISEIINFIYNFDITTVQNSNKSIYKTIEVYIYVVLKSLLTNIYMMIINNLGESISYTFVDNIIFILMFRFFSTLNGFIYTSIKTKGKVIKDIKEGLSKNYKYYLITGLPVRILVLLGMIDTTIGSITSIQLSLNIIFYVIIHKIYNYDSNVQNKYLLPNNRLYVVCLILFNIVMGLMITFFNNSKYGVIGIIIAIFCTFFCQFINVTFENNEVQKNDNIDEYIKAYISAPLMGFLYLFLITICVSLAMLDNVKMELYTKYMYIPFFMSMIIVPFEINSLGQKNKVDNYGMINNISIPIVTTLTVFITPLFDSSINNNYITYLGIIPCLLSIFVNIMIKNNNNQVANLVPYQNINIHNDNP